VTVALLREELALLSRYRKQTYALRVLVTVLVMVAVDLEVEVVSFVVRSVDVAVDLPEVSIHIIIVNCIICYGFDSRPRSIDLNQAR
jgi:hypothetical protein